jgi:hypothetical protein
MKHVAHHRSALALVPLTLLLWGCKPGPSNGDAGIPGDAVYAISSTVLGETSDTSYLSLLSTLDVTEIDYTQAREYPGRTSNATYNGWLFVADAEAPIVTRYSVNEDGTLHEDGRLSFSKYGGSVSLDDWSNTFISATKAYLLIYAEGLHVVWNPTTLELTGEIPGGDLVRAGLDLDGSTGVVRGNRFYRTVFWKDWQRYESSTDQFLAIIDTDTDTLQPLVKETRCPALNNRIERDEQGNLYFSNWIYNVTETLVRNAPKSCALRINAGSDSFDPSWVLRFADLAEGREASALSYLKDGKGFINVFHNERVTIDPSTNPRDLAFSTNWRLWSVNLNARSAQLIEGIDWLAGGYSTVKLDNRTFVLVPGDEYDKTHVYEVSDNGKAELRFDTRGFTYQLVRLK